MLVKAMFRGASFLLLLTFFVSTSGGGFEGGHGFMQGGGRGGGMFSGEGGNGGGGNGGHHINCSTTENVLGDPSDSPGMDMFHMHGCDTNHTRNNFTMAHNGTHDGRDGDRFDFNMNGGQHHQQGDNVDGTPQAEENLGTTTVEAMSTVSGGVTMQMTSLVVATLVGSAALLNHLL